MSYRLSRRRALAGLSASAALPLIACAPNDPRPADSESVFAHGVASGDPEAHSVVIWTRLSIAEDRAAGEWVVAEDQALQRVVARGSYATDRSRDMTIKQVVSGLTPGKSYYYGFLYGSVRSMVGRTRTLPSGPLEKLGIAIASCSNYPFGYFNAYETIALDPAVDLVLHLGDYIYEYGPDGYGGETGRNLGREHLPRREIISLADYRARHAQYKGDPQSQAMHAAHPLIAVWDDHESTNNPWRGGAQNHQPAEEGDWATRRDASLQAYYEWMPVRDPSPGTRRDQYWRHFRFGDLASLVTLETRHSGRDQQIAYADFINELNSPADAERFMREVVGAPGREMLSGQMKNFVLEALQESVAAERPWRLIGNQIPMARTRTPELTDQQLRDLAIDESHPLYKEIRRFRALGQLGLPLYLDPWDGYPWAREQFYQLCRSAGAEDLLVLTGDSHSFWQNQLFDEQGAPMGLELGTTGITSPGDFLGFGQEGAQLMDGRLAEVNEEVLWTEGRTHGYVRLVLTPARATVDYVGVSTITERNYLPVNLRQLRIERGGKHIRYA